MRSRFGHFLARFSVLVMAIGLMAGVVTATTAQAQAMRSLRELMFGKHAAETHDTNHTPIVAHFVSARGAGFVLDESQASPLLRFDGDDEVFQLTAKPGANGDITFRNDVGEPVLKATRLGGMILFSGARADVGDPVAATGQAPAFAPDHLNPAELWLHMAKSALRVTRDSDHRVDFTGYFETPSDSVISLFAETTSVTADALVQIASQMGGRPSIDKLHEVHMIEGRPPSAHIENGVLVIKLDVSKGTWGGHPSSKRIMNVVMTGNDDEMRH